MIPTIFRILFLIPLCVSFIFGAIFLIGIMLTEDV